MTTERNTGPGGNQELPAASEPDGVAAKAGLPRRRVILRGLVIAGYVAGLGIAVGSWARPAADEVVPEAAELDSGDVQGCAEGLPPGHPPVENLMGLPLGHPPIRSMPRLPAGHPPIQSVPPPAFTAPPLQTFTI
jgi:hypothetical protein